jgi:hypothetical protein
MNLQDFILICLIIFVHIKITDLYTSKLKENFINNFIDSRATSRAFNCGECFYKKTKDVCEKSLTGKFCDTPCKWSKTIKYNSDGTKIIRQFCEESRPFYQIRNVW